jgi:hypothetical protein
VALFLAIYLATDAVGELALRWFMHWTVTADPTLTLRKYEVLREAFRELTLRAHYVVLTLGSIIYGFYRSVKNHPAGSPGYKKWLKSTPWHAGMPLPLGPAMIRWWDGLVVAGALALNHWTGESPWLLVILPCLISYSIGSLLMLSTVGQARDAYAIAFGGSLILWAAPHPFVMLGVAVVLCLIGHEGLRTSLTTFPWEETEKKKVSSEPWPLPIYENAGPRVGFGEAVLGVGLAMSWYGALIYQLQAKGETVVMEAAIAAIGAGVIRWLVYCGTYRPPLTLLGRIVRMRLILPGYDQALVIPWLTLLVGITVPITLNEVGGPPPVVGMMSVGLTLMIALTGGPNLRVWQLTGYHRMTGGSTGKIATART